MPKLNSYTCNDCAGLGLVHEWCSCGGHKFGKFVGDPAGCQKCGGMGDGWSECPTCGGTGVVYRDERPRIIREVA